LARLIFLLVCMLVVPAVVLLTPTAIENLRYQDFVVSGTVVDESGRPLDDVGVKLIAGRWKKMGTASDNDSRFERVNGSFQFEFHNYSAIDLRFFKEGYEQDRVQFTVGGEYSGIKIVLKPKETMQTSGESKDVK